MLWAFSIWLESVAILPQLFMLQRTGEAETITTHYLFAMGLYRALYIPNWVWRFFMEPGRKWDPIAVVGGIVQTVLYSDFFWIYYTKYVSFDLCCYLICLLIAIVQGHARSKVQFAGVGPGCVGGGKGVHADEGAHISPACCRHLLNCKGNASGAMNFERKRWDACSNRDDIEEEGRRVLML